ncbi:unnamed protein product [Symbiodinium natans]|uniref:Uncharacterized protein n=1 Tax=Symbiodinium natans TaxID=878477 RepID=A0A812Q3U9_9DINO|nr:unnamed protein product [Symbiodinium natans]
MVKGKTFSVHPRTRRRGKQSVGHQVAKSVQKANAKQLKRQAKQEQKVQGGFRKAMSTFYERNLAEDREYVYKTLSEHEEWLPKLSAMFKSGALQSILEDEQAGPEEEINLEQLGRKIKGRACKLMNLPKHGKLILLQEYTNLENMDEADMADDWLNDAMTFLFHISSKTPLPKVPNPRYSKVLQEQARLRVKALQFKGAERKLNYGDRCEIQCYYTRMLEGGAQALHCGFLGEMAELPKLPDNGVWEVDNSHSLTAVVVNNRNKCLSLSSSFFPNVQHLKPDEAWSYEAEAEEPEADGTALLSFANSMRRRDPQLGQEKKEGSGAEAAAAPLAEG